ncbi:MAG: SDR family NAD(P)-dependent oxidoreductase, partial [Treponema sp.]|nr:SDR family NAD(P)-dependent oxidoreductase [Treponema sp.]
MKETLKTAVVTGASQGVGREISLILAEKGCDIVIVARSADKLEAVKNDILQLFPDRSVYVCPCNLASSDGPEKVLDFCKQNSLTVDLLINNAGSGLFGESVELGDSVLPMLNLNITALTRMCSLFGKEMKTRGSGSILNIGSIAGNQPSSYFASYAATKSYVFNYTLALRYELKRYGVNVTLVQPGYIRTNFDNVCGVT